MNYKCTHYNFECKKLKNIFKNTFADLVIKNFKIIKEQIIKNLRITIMNMIKIKVLWSILKFLSNLNK